LKAAKARRDASLKHVVISEKYDKKAAALNVETLPHGYDSKEVYEGAMRTPLGPDVNFRDLTRPKILKNAGAVIKPMKFPKGRRPTAAEAKRK
jgi:U3 small nucleolar RNA-associated protein 14